MTSFAMLGDALTQMGRYAEAEKVLKRAVEGDPGCVAAWDRLGTIWGNLGKRDQAIAAFRQVIHYKPDHTWAHFHLGKALEQAGDRKEARKEYNETLRCQPDCEPARQALAELDSKDAKDRPREASSSGTKK